jgi:adenylate cyclase class 2
MNTEIEAKWLDIDHDKFREKLKNLGAKQVRPKTDMTRTVFDLPDKNSRREWVRVRDEGDKITLSYKKTEDESLTGTKEICVEVDDFDNTVAFLTATSFRQKSFQETRRETWELDGAEIDLDEWPWLPPFVEIETKTEVEMQKIAEKLDLSLTDAMHASVDLVYQKYYDVSTEDINKWPEARFGDVPEWLEKTRKARET